MSGDAGASPPPTAISSLPHQGRRRLERAAIVVNGGLRCRRQNRARTPNAAAIAAHAKSSRANGLGISVGMALVDLASPGRDPRRASRGHALCRHGDGFAVAQRGRIDATQIQPAREIARGDWKASVRTASSRVRHRTCSSFFLRRGVGQEPGGHRADRARHICGPSPSAVPAACLPR